MRRQTALRLLVAGAIAAPTAGAVDHQSDTDAHKIELILYPGSRVHPQDLAALGRPLPACSNDGPSTSLHLAPDVCLSGEHYLWRNFRIARLPTCADGSTPRLMYYPQRKCAGPAAVIAPEPAKSHLVDACLWSHAQVVNPSYYWSLIFRCGTSFMGQLAHQAAVPPAIMPQTSGNAPGVLGFDAGAGAEFREDAEQTALVDICYPMVDVPEWSVGVQVVVPPTCANGTRARLLRLDDCRRAESAFEDGMVDLNDEDLSREHPGRGRSFPLKGLKRVHGGRGDAKAVMLYCDGPERASSSPPVPSRPLVSHSYCHPPDQPLGQSRSTTFLEVDVETCVNAHQRQPLHVQRTVACPNSELAQLLTWRNHGCIGTPGEVHRVGKPACFDIASEADYSYRFTCGAVPGQPGWTDEDDTQRQIGEGEAKNAPEDGHSALPGLWRVSGPPVAAEGLDASRPQSGRVGPTDHTGLDPDAAARLWWTFWAGGVIIGLTLLALISILLWPFIPDILNFVKVSDPFPGSIGVKIVRQASDRVKLTRS